MLQWPCTLRSKSMHNLPAAQVCLDVYEHAPHSGASQVEAKKAFMDVKGCARQPAMLEDPGLVGVMHHRVPSHVGYQ